MRSFRASVGVFLALALWLLSACAGPVDAPASDGAWGESSIESILDASADVSLAKESIAISAPDDDSETTSAEPDAASSEVESNEETQPEHIHAFVGATCTEPGRCECGETDSALGHDFTAATCTEPSVCTRCGEVDGAALGHDNAGATCDEPGVCSRCGAKGNALGHDFAEATCTEPSACKRCGKTQGSALGHSYSGGKCKRCGDTNGPLSPEEAKLFKNKLSDEENAQALAAAREIVREIEEQYPDADHLDRIALAAMAVSYEYAQGVHLEEGKYYHTAYGVFVKRESSCAGCCRALGLVLSCMGYQWTHINENQWKHQWITVVVEGESVWADGQIGWAGVGDYPFYPYP